MTYVGIDPGKHGAIVLLDGDGAIQSYHLTPLADGDYDLTEMLSLVRSWSGFLVTIEACQAFPKIGARSNFEVGRGFGLWLGMLAACRVSHSVVHAATWHKRLCNGISVAKGHKKPAKLKARLVSERLWPGVFKASQDGLIDAALIAEYGRRENH
jgi:hypothetical protein